MFGANGIQSLPDPLIRCPEKSRRADSAISEVVQRPVNTPDLTDDMISARLYIRSRGSKPSRCVLDAVFRLQTDLISFSLPIRRGTCLKINVFKFRVYLLHRTEPPRALVSVRTPGTTLAHCMRAVHSACESRPRARTQSTLSHKTTRAIWGRARLARRREPRLRLHVVFPGSGANWMPRWRGEASTVRVLARRRADKM